MGRKEGWVGRWRVEWVEREERASRGVLWLSEEGSSESFCSSGLEGERMRM